MIIFLALLQFVAPLVHAHTGEEHGSQNLHLPGLEHFHLTSDSHAFQALTDPCTDSCSIISVGSAIKHKKVFTDNTAAYYLPANTLCNKLVVNRSIIQHSQQQIEIPARTYTLLPVRAPPSLYKALKFKDQTFNSY